MYSLKDSKLTIVRGILVGTAGVVPAGAPTRILSHNDVAFAPGGKATSIKGAAMLPIAIVLGTAEPKLDIDCSNGSEVWRARDAVGGIGSTVLVTLTLTRIGMEPTSWTWPGTWADGGGLALNESNGSKPDKVSVMCLDALQDLRSIYNIFA